MKKFMKKIAIGILCLFVLLLLLNTAYVRTHYYQNLNDMGKFRFVPEHIDVANFGASHSTLAFDWSEYSEEFQGFNMGLGSQTFVYDAAFFDYYIDRFDEDSTIIVDVMFKSLYEEEQDKGPYASNITRYYQVLPKKYIYQWNIKDAIQYGYLPILGNRQNAITNIENELMGHLSENSNNLTEIAAAAKIDISAGLPTQVLTGWEEEDMVAEGQRRAKSFESQGGAQQLGIQYKSLIHIIEKCKERNIQVILVTVPTLPCFYESFSDEYMKRFYSDMENICKEYNVLYLDYTGDERFLSDYRIYQDTDHLNSTGAEIFTKTFLEDNERILRFCKMN